MKIRIFIVNGISDTIAGHAQRYGVKRSCAYARIKVLHWTIEQAFGIEPPPLHKVRGNIGRYSPDLESVLVRVMAGELTAEEYLHFEGVAPNEHMLAAREAFSSGKTAQVDK